MIVKCLFNKAKEAFKGEKMPEGYFNDSEFGLAEIGKQYFVMGMFHNEDRITYLIDNDRIVVNYPSELFTVIDNKLCAEWYFQKYTKDDEMYPYTKAIYGYFDLCFDKEHLEKLLDLDENALQVYFKNKKISHT